MKKVCMVVPAEPVKKNLLAQILINFFSTTFEDFSRGENTCNSIVRKVLIGGCLRSHSSVSSRTTSDEASSEKAPKASPDASDWQISIQHVNAKFDWRWCLSCCLRCFLRCFLCWSLLLRNHLRWRGRTRKGARRHPQVNGEVKRDRKKLSICLEKNRWD